MPKKLNFPRDTVSLQAATYWIVYDRMEGPTAAHMEDFVRRSEAINRQSGGPWMNRSPEQVREAVEQPAREELLVTLRDGDLRAIGRLSETQTYSWNAMNGPWGLHSGKHTEIPLEYWVGGQASIGGGKLTYSSGEYIDIRVPLFFVQTIWPIPTKDPATLSAQHMGISGSKPLPFAPTPFLELLNLAVEQFWHSGSPPTDKKDTIVAWLTTQEVGGEPLSRNLADAMATIIRPPEARAGGNRRYGE